MKISFGIRKYATFVDNFLQMYATFCVIPSVLFITLSKTLVQQTDFLKRKNTNFQRLHFQIFNKKERNESYYSNNDLTELLPYFTERRPKI